MVIGEFAWNAVRRWDYMGIRCCVKRQPSGGERHSGLNGYVFVPPDHPWNDSDDYGEGKCEVWGGLTFSKSVGGGRWIGFDDCHLDPCPRGMEEETERLARQVFLRGYVARAFTIVTLVGIVLGSLIAVAIAWWLIG